ncbi:MAG: hypothetical protein ABSE73_02635 [Planctomycetota bacterium]
MNIRTSDAAAHDLLSNSVGELRTALKTEFVTVQAQPQGQTAWGNTGQQNNQAQYQGGAKQERQGFYEPERQTRRQPQPEVFEELVKKR